MGSIGISQTKGTFPSRESVPTFWRSELHPLDSHRSTNKLPPSCDILIIGAGYAGISSAYHLLCNEDITRPVPSPSVVLLEARGVCSGASARNGGNLRPSIFGRAPMYLERYGIDKVLELVDFECDNLASIARLIEKEKIECDFIHTKSLNVYVKKEEANIARKAWEELKKAGGSRASIRNSRWIDEAEAEEVSGVKGATGCFQFMATKLWPYKLVVGLLNRAVDAGLNLQTHTPAHHIFPCQGEPGKWVVSTSRGPIIASKVIFATNGYTSGLLPEYETKIVPSKGICCRIVYSPDKPHRPVENSCCMWLANGSCDYMISRHDNSMIVGGARAAFFDDMTNWYNRTDDDSLIESAQSYFDNYMQTNFCGWEKSDAHVESIWTGIMGYNSDSLPNLGEVPERPGCFLAAGFQGNGMPIIWPVTEGIAKMVLMGKSYKDTGLPLFYQTSKERLKCSTDHMLGRA